MENEQETVTHTEEKNEAPVTQTEEKNETTEVKTFTQEEVNAILAKERKKVPSKEELKAYNDWKESQKTETEKQNELNQKYTNATNENVLLKQEITVLKANVDREYADYVQFAVSKMEGDFEDNLKSFLKDNPKYLQKEETANISKTTGIPVSNTTKIEKDGVLAILEEKHPEAFN